jgi:UDP-4-amino-4,6-dideoxy-N-acetyl-beta-L-altrosamine transaminase
MTNIIPYGKHDISKKDINSVIKVLKSDWLTQGPLVPLFENEMNKICNSTYSVAVNSATAALHIACLSLDLKQGDWLWTSPISFVASANCALYCGAKVDFVDIELETFNISIVALENKLQIAKKNNKLPKIIIPVHFAGHSCDMKEIYKLSKIYGFKIIEDASHAIGGQYLNNKIGNCKYSDITIFSFHPVKIITTGEGGMALTNNFNLAIKMRQYRSHGITNEKEYMIQKSDGEIWNYQQINLGYNYRMTDIQAALGMSQLARVNKFVTKREFIALRYNNELNSDFIQTPVIKPYANSSHHLYTVLLKPNINFSQKSFYEKLISKGINVNVHYIPIYLQPYYSQIFKYPKGYCPNSEAYFRTTITLPIFTTLTRGQQSFIIDTVNSFFN